MGLIWLCLIMFILSNAIKVLFKIDKKYMVILSMALIGIPLYIFGFVGLLKYGLYFIYLLSFISCIYLIFCLIKKRIKFSDLFSPTIIYFILFSIITFFLVKGCKFTEWDEFSHWGTNLKFMFYNNQLWGSKLWEGVHEGYPPLAGIIEYFVLKLFGTYNESFAFFALDMFMLAIISPMLKASYKIHNIIKNILFILTLYMVIKIFGFGINSIYIDLPLAILFASSFYIAINIKDKEDKIVLGIVLFMLPILKDTGVIMGGIVLLYLFTNQIINSVKDKKFDYKKYLPILYYFLIICAAYLSWKVFCKINGTGIDFRHDSNAIATFNIIEYIKSLLLVTTGKNQDIALSFYDFLNNGGVISRYPFQTIIQLIVAINIFALLMKHFNIIKGETTKSLLISLDVGIVLYILFMLMVYLFVMLEPEGRSLASFPRYINTYFIAWVIILISLCIKYKKKILPIFVCFIVCLYGTNIMIFAKPFNKNVDIVPKDDYKMFNSIKDYLNNDDKLFIVLQNNDGGLFHPLRYLLSPIKIRNLHS